MSVFMNSNNDQYNVIKEILHNYLQDTELKSAIDLWKRQYDGQSIDKLNFFVFEIATTSKLRNLRKNILSDLEEALKQIKPSNEKVSDQQQQSNQTEQKTLPEKIPSQTNQRQETYKYSELQKLIEALTYFLSCLFVHLESEKSSEIQMLLQEYLQENKLPISVQKELLQWFINREKFETLVEKPEYTTAIVNVVYSILCEYFGPMKTDRLVSQAVHQTEQKFVGIAIKPFL